jgi:hypothetical protein
MIKFFCFKLGQRFESVQRNLLGSLSSRAEIIYHFDFERNLIDKEFSFLANQQQQNGKDHLDSSSKQRILLLRDVGLNSISFDINQIYFQNKLAQNNFKTNLFTLSSFDDLTSSFNFLFGLNLILLAEQNSNGSVLQGKFELFTGKQRIQSTLPIDLPLLNNHLNVTFTFNSIELYVNNDVEPLVKLDDRNNNLFYKSLLKAYASFQFSLLANRDENFLALDKNNDRNSNLKASESISSICFSNFMLTTRKSSSSFVAASTTVLATSESQLHRYSLIDQTKQIRFVDDLKTGDTNEQCIEPIVELYKNKMILKEEQTGQRSTITHGLNECFLVSKYNVNVNKKMIDYYMCKCNETDSDGQGKAMCSFDFWSKFIAEQQNSQQQQLIREETNDETDIIVGVITNETNSCDILNAAACFNNGTCVEPTNQITENYLCLCPKYYTGSR